MSAWGSQSIQLAWFFFHQTAARVEEVFANFAGEEPTVVQRNKTPNPANPLTGFASGVANERNYQVQLQPGRMDVIVTPMNVDEDDGDSVALLPTISTLSDLLSRIGPVCEAVGNATRLAGVANMVDPQPDEASAINRMFEVFGFQPNLDGVRDPLLQLNKRKSIPGSNVEMNRLMRFGVAATQRFVINVDPGMGAANSAIPVSLQTFGTNLVLDFNTVPSGEIIESADQVAIFGTIVDELRRIAEVRSIVALGE